MDLSGVIRVKRGSSLLATLCVAGGMFVSQAYASVSVSEAERLKSVLTPMGGQREGNGRDIPPWRGGLTLPPVEYKEPGQHHPDPFPDDQPLFTVTAQNMNQYSNNLTEGQKEMFRTYPDTFKMPVYQTRRTAAAPEWVYENTYKNALRAELADGGNSLLYSYAGIPKKKK